MNNSAIITTYFSKKIHPNNPDDSHVTGRIEDGRVLQNDFAYIKDWYNSIVRNDLQGFVFYDNLNDEFVNKYANKNVTFVKVSTGEYSNNDWRFFCYRQFLQEHKFDNVFLTDGSDVVVVKDPSAIIAENNDTDFFICKDNINISQFGYLSVHEQVKWDNYSWFAMEHLKGKLPLINMGVIGATYKNMLDFLDKFCLVRIKMANPDFNADMWVGQYVFRHLLSDKKILLGSPFTSDFKEYQNDRKDVYFIHK